MFELKTYPRQNKLTHGRAEHIIVNICPKRFGDQGISIDKHKPTSSQSYGGRSQSRDTKRNPNSTKSRMSKCKILKTVVAFFFSLLSVALLCLSHHYIRYIFDKSDESEKPNELYYGIYASFVFLVALGLTFSVAIRCILLLMIPALFTTRGRIALFAVILQVLILGPVKNMGKTAILISESTNCQIELLSNHTNDALEIIVNKTNQLSGQYGDVLNQLVAKNEQILEKLQQQRAGIQTIMERVNASRRRVFKNMPEIRSDLLTKLNPFDSSNLKVSKYASGLNTDMAKRFNYFVEHRPKVGDIAGGMFAKATSKIGDIPWIQLKNLTLVMSNLTVHKFHQNISQLSGSLAMNNSHPIKIIFDNLKTDYSGTVMEIQNTIHRVTLVLPWCVLLVLIQSLLYRRGFLTKIEYDNVYITSEFKAIDQRSKTKKELPLLPLKRREKSSLVDITSCTLSKREQSSFSFPMFLVSIFMLMGVFVLAVDYGLSVLLTSLHEQMGSAMSNYHHTHSDFISTLSEKYANPAIRDILLHELSEIVDVNRTQLAYEIHKNMGQCLLEGEAPIVYDTTKLIVLSSLYLFVIAVSVLQPYGLRLQHRVAAYFYPQQELKRINYLYHSIRGQRMSIKRLLIEKMKEHFSNRHESAERRGFCKVMELWCSTRFPFFRGFLLLLGKMQASECSACGVEVSPLGHVISDSGQLCDICIEQAKKIICAEN